MAGALEQIQQLPAVKSNGASVSLYNYDQPSYTGSVFPTECYFPAWALEEAHVVCQTLINAYTTLFGKKPGLGNWAFSTNGTAIMGRHNIPCIGFGPGQIDQAHTPDESIVKKDLAEAATMYAAIPGKYMETLNNGT